MCVWKTGEKTLTRHNLRSRRDTRVSGIWFTTNSKQTGSGSKSVCRCEGSKDNRLSHGKALPPYRFLDRHNNFRGNCFLRRTEIELNSVILRAPDGTLSSLDATKPACSNSWAVYRNYCAVANVSGQQTYLLIICSNCSCALRGLPQRVQNRRGQFRRIISTQSYIKH
jgi:hypothetical protein